MKKIKYILIMVIVLSSMGFSQDITNKLGTNGNYIITDATGTPRYFIVNKTTGNVAIGTSVFDAANPEKFLIDCGTTNSVNAIYTKGTINDYFQFNIRNLSNGSQASSDIVATADNGTESSNYVNMGINGSGYVWEPWNPVELGKPNDCYLLGHGNDLLIANSNANKDIIFMSGGTMQSNERLRIKSNGKIGIGVSNPSQLLTLSGGAYSNGSSWSNSSDSTLKRNIETLNKYGITDLMKIRSVSYYYKSDLTNKLEIGFIAQELKNIIPEVVSGEEGNMGISYGNLVPVLVNSIKEQQTQIDEQNTKIERLSKDVNELKAINKTQSAGMEYEITNVMSTIFLTVLAWAVVVLIVKLIANRRSDWERKIHNY
jgi:hypothetical protein